MQKQEFAEAVEQLIASDARYTREAYYFVRDALDQSMKLRPRAPGESGHVTGQQICEGARQLAIKQFGPMVPTVFEYWGIHKTEDIGEMIWNLIDLEVFSSTETDSKDDFRAVYSFHDAFVLPFSQGLPARRPVRPAVERVKQ